LGTRFLEALLREAAKQSFAEGRSEAGASEPEEDDARTRRPSQRLTNWSITMSTEEREKTAIGPAAAPGLALAGNSLHAEFRHLKSQWWCLLLLGIFLVVCGTVAVLFPILSNIAVMVVLGLALLATGIATIVTSFWAGKWSGLLLQLLVGILYVVVGLQIADTPVESGLVMAIFLAGFFIVVGAFRVVAALAIRFPHWGWALLNGIVTFLFGVVIYRHFPQCAFWVVGMLVGVEMLLNGWTWIALALSIRRIPEEAA
jgi:uncharacterized membrane protein HdeD (DUF308 family)